MVACTGIVTRHETDALASHKVFPSRRCIRSACRQFLSLHPSGEGQNSAIIARAMPSLDAQIFN
jgi:hypothetical protein